MKTLYDRLKPEYKTLLDNHEKWAKLKETVSKGLEKNFAHDLTLEEITYLSYVTKDFDYNNVYDLFHDN